MMVFFVEVVFLHFLKISLFASVMMGCHSFIGVFSKLFEMVTVSSQSAFLRIIQD